MTAEQLQTARAAAWRQQGNALLTADDAAAWLRETGIALFLPRTAQIAAPAGSFVEATSGAASSTPSPSAIESATGLLDRLLTQADAIALNLLGSPGDQPDFIASPEAFPFIFALRGDKEWKRGPRGKSSPLVVEVWKTLDRDGALSADEIKQSIGRHLTESAALRALTELWSTLRVEPVYPSQSGEKDTRWQLLQANHEKAMEEGSAIGNGIALSALASLYIQSAIAVTSSEVEAFLSPLASRSRIRESVNGLLATKQLGLRNLGPREHFYVEGTLPDFLETIRSTPETAPDERQSISAALPDLLSEVEAARITAKIAPKKAASAKPEAASDTVVETVLDSVSGAFRIEALSDDENERERTVGEGRKRFVAQRGAQGGDRKTFGNRPTSARSGPFRTGAGRPGPGRPSPGRPSSDRPGFSSRPSSERKPFTRNAADGPRGASPSASPYGGEASEGKKPFFAREPWKEDRKPRPEGADRPFPPREGADRKPFSPRAGARPFSGGAGKPFSPRGGSDRKPFTPRAGFGSSGSGDSRSSGGSSDRKPFTPREGGRPFSGGDRKPFAPRDGGDRKPFSPRPGAGSYGAGGRKPFAPREGGRPFSGGDRKPFTPRDGGDRKPFSPRPSAGAYGAGDRKPFAPREGGRPFSGGDRKPFSPRDGGDRKPFSPRPFSPRPGGSSSGGTEAPRRTGRPGATPQRFSPEGGRPSRPGAFVSKPGGKKPRTSSFTSTGQPRANVGKTGRPGPRTARPGKPASGRKPGAPPRKPGGKGPKRDA